MKKIMGLIGATIGGWIGWYVGMMFGMFGAFVVSTIASGFGMYYAVKWAKNNLG